MGFNLDEFVGCMEEFAVIDRNRNPIWDGKEGVGRIWLRPKGEALQKMIDSSFELTNKKDEIDKNDVGAEVVIQISQRSLDEPFKVQLLVSPQYDMGTLLLNGGLIIRCEERVPSKETTKIFFDALGREYKRKLHHALGSMIYIMAGEYASYLQGKVMQGAVEFLDEMHEE